nr:hypothetical protein [Tanacetum cinerariifolium]
MSTILSESALEKALHVALELLKKAAKALLKKDAEALERHAGTLAPTYAEEEESVKSAIEEVERLLTELVKLKGHEVMDDHSYKFEGKA